MFDEQMWRDLYEKEIAAFGRVVTSVGIFDQRLIAWPRESLPAAVEAERGRPITLDSLDRMARDGLFEWREDQRDDGPVVGVPMYVAWRIAMLAELESRGWAQAELREVAEWEEWIVSDLLTSDHLTYEDSDIDTLLRRMRDLLTDVEGELCIRTAAAGGEIDRTNCSWNSKTASKSTERLENERQRYLRIIRDLKKTDLTTVSEEWRCMIEREAYITRHWQETMRAVLIHSDRMRLEAGFNRTVAFTGEQDLLPDPKDLSTFGTVDWIQTLAAWPLQEAPDHYPVRLPGFVLIGGRSTLDSVLTPSDYAERHELFALEEYPEAFAALMGTRRCAHCEGLLSRDAHERRRYCSDECSNAARQRRFRENQKADILRQRGTSMPANRWD